MNYYLGFDPGGDRKFGWCACSPSSDGGLQLIAAGNASHAKGAFDAALAAVPNNKSPTAAGIDAPLYWVADGGRRSDSIVRDAIGRAGAPNRSGTVQHFNSLQGSCVIQGMLLAKLLRSRYPALPVTEAHPKALLWLLGLASTDRPANTITAEAVCSFEGRQFPRGLSEHARDAVLGAITAKAMATKESGWTDLLPTDNDAVRAVEGPLGYWMPMTRGRS